MAKPTGFSSQAILQGFVHHAYMPAKTTNMQEGASSVYLSVRWDPKLRSKYSVCKVI